MDKFYKSIQLSLVWIWVLLFIIFYPMLISIYVFLPLIIGIMGYILIRGIEKGKLSYAVLAILYFINLEVNLSLPFFLIIISTLLVYILFYPYLIYFQRCRICKPIVSILLLDTVYLGLLLSYDFIFQSHSIVLDNILLYSLVVDLLVAVIL